MKFIQLNTLHTFPDRLVLEGESQGTTKFLQLSCSPKYSCTVTEPTAKDGALTSLSRSGAAPLTSCKALALVGVIHLSYSYLLYVSDAESLGKLAGQHPVFRCACIQIAQIPSSLQLGPLAAAAEGYYLDCLRVALDVPSLYYSLDFDLTHSQQHAALEPSLSRRQFLWNGFLLDSISAVVSPSSSPPSSSSLSSPVASPSSIFSSMESRLAEWRVPMICGFLALHQFSFAHPLHGPLLLSFSLISRRSVHRVGTRFNRRGIDKHGRAANFVETEQVISADPQRCFSFLQVRGSAPFFWQQYANMRFVPTPSLRPGYALSDHLSAFKSHVAALQADYGDCIVCVNLVDHHGREEFIHRTFASLCETVVQQKQQQQSNISPNLSLHYIPFDFHRACHNLAFDNARTLLQQLTGLFSWFQSTDGRLVARQTSVFRVNCIDSLDRSNLIMSQNAERFTDVALQELGLLPAVSDPTAARISTLDPAFYLGVFKRAWADNGDALSLQYAGSLALKNDYTRTGKRTSFGVLQDIAHSARRYFCACWKDGIGQDAFDLLLGEFVPARDRPISPQRVLERGTQMDKVALWKTLVFQSVLIVLSLCFVSYILAPVGDISGLRTSSVLFWLIFMVVTLNIIDRHPGAIMTIPVLHSENVDL